MSLINTLIKAGALYAVGRYSSKVKAEDVERVTGISGDDVRRYGLDRADSLLHQVGLQRASTVPSSAVLVLSGFAAGALVGSGLTFLLQSDLGKGVRQKISELFRSEGADETVGEADASAVEAGPPAAGANGGVKVTA